MMQRRTRTLFGCWLVGVSLLVLAAGCGKRPSETPLQRAERVIKTVQEKYQPELAVIACEQDQKKLKKELGKLVENRNVKWHKSDRFNTFFLGSSWGPDKTPFHRFIEIVGQDIKRLKSSEDFLADGGHTAQLELSKDLRCMLFEAKQALLKHKEYKNEARFAALRQDRASSTTVVVYR